MRNRIRFYSGFLAALLLLIGANADARTVRIGVYDNPPKVEMGEDGAPRGIFIDIAACIAKREGWNIEYVNGTWDAGLKRLEKDSIDIMPDVALSENRDRRFDFNQITVLSSWLQVFCRKGIAMESISALEGKTIAILEGSIQQQVCGEIRGRFGFSFNEIALPDYKSTIKHVISGKADAVIVSRFYAYQREKESALAPTSIIFHPTTLHYAAAKGRNRDLLDAIDKHLAVMMNDPHSEYYRSLACWLSERPRTFVPPVIIWSIVFCALALLFFVMVSLLLRWQVRKRTKELLEKNKELIAAVQELKTAQREAIKRERLYALGQLASGIAHDFNNLMVPILSYSDLPLNDPAELENKEKMRRNFEAIKTAAGHGKDIVQRMQNFCRTAKHPEQKERVDINAIIHDVIALTGACWKGSSRSGEAPVEVVCKLDSAAEITGNRSDIHELLLNLALNAADAMPEGGCFEITTQSGADAVTVTVKDNGIGMSEETRAQCLKPFFTTKGAKGTGIGLTMVNSIVAEHGGSMEIASAPGKGTSVVITFPKGS